MTSLYLFIYLFFTNFTHFHSFPYFHNLLSKSTSKLMVIFAFKKKTNGNLCIWMLFFQFLSCFSKVSFFFALLLIHHICPYSSFSLSLWKLEAYGLGFTSELMELIILCVYLIFYSFLLNSSQFGSVLPSRGLR